MPPKFKFTREEIINSAVDIVRKGGLSVLTARALAAELGSSVKPIFGLFQNMEEVQTQVLRSADSLYQAYVQKEMAGQQYPPYKASGIAYIQFAKEEQELFKLLFMRNRTGETILENREAVRPLLNLIMQNLGVDEDSAYLLHIELWVYVHGIATMMATSYLNWDMDFVSKSLTDVYEGLKYRYTEVKA